MAASVKVLEVASLLEKAKCLLCFSNVSINVSVIAMKVNASYKC